MDSLNFSARIFSHNFAHWARQADSEKSAPAASRQQVNFAVFGERLAHPQVAGPAIDHYREIPTQVVILEQARFDTGMTDF